jgi:integrase
MTKLKSNIETVLKQLKGQLARKTWESRRRYYNQLISLADKLQITAPCQELYDAFIADDHGSAERRSLHVRCVKLLDTVAGTQAKSSDGIYFNETPLPEEKDVIAFFSDKTFPITNDINIRYLIVKAELEMRCLNLSQSTIGQYRHAWINICRYCESLGKINYNEGLLQSYLQRTNYLHHSDRIKKWRWKINRKAAYVLMEVASTGKFQWKNISKNLSFRDKNLEQLHQQFQEALIHSNLSKSTVDLRDYVFRKLLEFSNVHSLRDLYSLQPETVCTIIYSFSDVCNQNSMATILSILRSTLKELYLQGFIERNLSGMVLNGNNPKGTVTAYLSEQDEKLLLSQLQKESKRDKSIILIALRLGLRDCDITNLTFHEINWSHDRIALKQTKTGEPLILPLLSDVGNALMDYILHERPSRKDGYPYIFLRIQAPYNKLSSIYSICSRILKKINARPINGTSVGTHLFRYSLVHRLLKAKIPHQVITDVLGHTSKESDKPYLSMEDSMLRLCALDLSVIGTPSWEVSR